MPSYFVMLMIMSASTEQEDLEKPSDQRDYQASAVRHLSNLPNFGYPRCKRNVLH